MMRQLSYSVIPQNMHGMYFVIGLLGSFSAVQFLIIYMKKLLDSDCHEECNCIGNRNTVPKNEIHGKR